MKTTFKPENFNSVSPYLLVQNMLKTLELLERVFNARVVHQHERNGKLVHVSVKIDDSIVMLGQIDENESLTPCHVHVYVPNITAVFNKAIEQGCTIIQPLVKRDDGDIRGAFKDTNNISWWIGNQS